MSGDALSNRIINAEIRAMRKKDLKFFMNADEFNRELEKLRK